MWESAALGPPLPQKTRQRQKKAGLHTPVASEPERSSGQSHCPTQDGPALRTIPGKIGGQRSSDYDRVKACQIQRGDPTAKKSTDTHKKGKKNKEKNKERTRWKVESSAKPCSRQSIPERRYNHRACTARPAEPVIRRKIVRPHDCGKVSGAVRGAERKIGRRKETRKSRGVVGSGEARGR